MHRHPAEANLPTPYGPARNNSDAGCHELDEFAVEGMALGGWLVSEDGIFTTAAKQKELQSFFDNAVWSDTHEADPSLRRQKGT